MNQSETNNTPVEPAPTWPTLLLHRVLGRYAPIIIAQFQFIRKRGLLAYLPLVALVPLLFFLSEGKVRIAPVPLVTASLAALLIARLSARSSGSRALDLLLAALCGVTATHILFMPGFPQGHDIITHLWGAYGFFHAVDAGNFVPRWTHHQGVGMPLFLFYPPLSFYALLPFHFAGLSTFNAFKLGFVLFNALSGLSMYFVVHRWTKHRSAALLAALAYCFAPYHMTESQVRVAIAEAAAMAVLPLFFYYVEKALREPSRKHFRCAAVWVAVLAFTHPLSLSMAGIAMGIWVLVQHRFRPGMGLFRALGRLAGVGLIGALLAGYYTVPVAAEGQYVTIQSTLGGKKPLYANYGLLPMELLERREWSSWQKAEPHSSKKSQDEMPFYFGLTLLALLPLAKDRDGETLALGLKGLTIGALVLTLTPLDMALAWLPPLRMLQFPWRFLAIATFGAAALVGWSLSRIQEDLTRPALKRFAPGLLALLFLADFFPYQGAPAWQKPYQGIFRLTEKGFRREELPPRVDKLSFPPSDTSYNLGLLRHAYPEYFTRKTRDAFKNSKSDNALERIAVGMSFDQGSRPRMLKPKPYAEFFPADGGPSAALSFARGGEVITVALPGKAGTLEVKEQWFPGWIQTLEGKSQEVGETQDGLMRIEVSSANAGELRLTFSRTRWDRLLGLLTTLCTFLVLFFPRPDEKTPTS